MTIMDKQIDRASDHNRWTNTDSVPGTDRQIKLEIVRDRRLCLLSDIAATVVAVKGGSSVLSLAISGVSPTWHCDQRL